jgi:tryptophan synthase alpha subunit
MHLHPSRWPELSPEFEAHAHLSSALDALMNAPVLTDSIARALESVRLSLANLCPATRCPEAREEHAQRLAGTYVGGATVTSSTSSDRDTITELMRRVRELEGRP